MVHESMASRIVHDITVNIVFLDASSLTSSALERKPQNQLIIAATVPVILVAIVLALVLIVSMSVVLWKRSHRSQNSAAELEKSETKV